MKGIYKRDWRLPAFEGCCPSPIDWARLAAYIDGEGSILINTQKRDSYSSLAVGFYLRVTVANTDVRLMVWLKDTFGGSYCGANTAKYYVGKNFKTAYHWGASSHRGAWLLHNCMPYFILKGEQAEIGMELQASMGKFIMRGRGRFLPDEVRDERLGLKRRLLKLKARGLVMDSAQEQRIREVS